MIGPILRGMYDDLAAVGAITEAQRFELEVLLEERIIDEQRRARELAADAAERAAAAKWRRWWLT